MGPTVILIPAYNEADRIRDTIVAVKDAPGIDDVVVVDDGSEDDTASAASECGARVIRLQSNCGKGAALNKALAEVDAEIYLLVDADLGSSAAETLKLLEPVQSGQADMSILSITAPPGHKAGFGLVKGLARWGIKRFGGGEMSAPISGQRAIRGEVIKDIGELEEGYGVEVALTIDALRMGYKVVEVPLDITHRFTGRNLSGFIHRGRQFKDVLRAILRRRKHRPDPAR